MGSEHTPGPWGWFGNTEHGGLYLATVNDGRRLVMDFVRQGMQSAQPRFQVNGLMIPAVDLVKYEVAYRKDITGVDHPDARLIALAPEMFEYIRRLANAGDPVAAQLVARARGTTP